MYTKSEKLDRQLFATLGVPLDPHKQYSLDDLTKRILASKPPKLRTIERLIKERREFLEWMALLFRERVVGELTEQMLRQDNEALVKHSQNNECTCSLKPDFFQAFHRRNMALHSQLKSKHIQKLEAHLEICLTQLHQALLKNNFLEQRALQMEAEVESIVQQHRQNILRLSQSFAAHTMMTTAQQRFQSLRSFPHQMPVHPAGPAMFHPQMQNVQYPQQASSSMAKLPELNIQMSQGSLHNNLLQTSDTMGSLYAGFQAANPLGGSYFMPPPPNVQQMGFPTLAAMQQSASLGQMQSSGNRSETSLTESIGGQKKTTLNQIDQLKQLITNMTPREELQIPQTEWTSPVTSENSDAKKKVVPQKAPPPSQDQRQSREKTKERSLSHDLERTKNLPSEKAKPKRDKTPPVSSKPLAKRPHHRKDTSKSPLRTPQSSTGGQSGTSGQTTKRKHQQGAVSSRNPLPPRPEELPLQRSKTPIQRSHLALGPFSNRHSSSGDGFSPTGRSGKQVRPLPKTPDSYDRPLLTEESTEPPFPFDSVVSPKFSESPDISSKVRLATEVPVSGQMSFSGSDGSESKGDILKHLPHRLSAERQSRNLSTPKSKLYYKTDTVTTPTSSSPFDEKTPTHTIGLYKGNVKNLPNYLKPTRSSVNQSASLFQEDRTPKRANKNIQGRVPSQNNLRSSRNSKLRTSTSTLTKKEIDAHLLNKSPKYHTKTPTATSFASSHQPAPQKQQSKQMDSKKELRHKLEGIRSSRKNPSRTSEAASYSETSAGVRSESEYDEEHCEGIRPVADIVRGQQEDGLSIIKEDLSHAKLHGMSEQSSMSHKSSSSQKQLPSLHSSDQKFKKKRIDSQEGSEDQKDQLVPNFGGGGLEKLKRSFKEGGGGTHSNSSLSSQNRKNSLATLEFINRPSGAKSPMLSSRTGKSQTGLSPKNGGTFDMANLRGDAHVFSGGEQDSFSFDLGQLEEKINSAELGMEWYCNFDTPNRDRREVEEENDEIKKILGNVNKQTQVVEVGSPHSQRLLRVKKGRGEKQLSDANEMRDSGADRPEILSFLEVQKDESMDFETREKLALELAKIEMEHTEEKEEEQQYDEEEVKQEEVEDFQAKSFNSSPVGLKGYAGQMARRDLTIQDPYLLSEPSYKGKSMNLELDQEELKMQFRTYSPMPMKTLKRSVTPTERETSKIPGLRQMPLKLTPRGSVPSLFDTKRQTSPITRNQFGFKGE